MFKFFTRSKDLRSNPQRIHDFFKSNPKYSGSTMRLQDMYKLVGKRNGIKPLTFNSTVNYMAKNPRVNYIEKVQRGMYKITA